MKIEEIVDCLSSGDLETQISALAEARSVINRLAGAAVEAFARSSNRYQLAERLPWLGSACVKPLLNLLADAEVEDSGEVEELASLGLLHFGNKEGVRFLLHSIEIGSPSSPLAASYLGKWGIAEARPVIIGRLQSCQIGDADEIASLILALQELGCELPQEIKEKVKAWSTSVWVLRGLVD